MSSVLQLSSSEPILHVTPVLHLIGDLAPLGNELLGQLAAKGYKLSRYDNVQDFSGRFVNDREVPQCVVISQQLRAGLSLQQSLAHARLALPIIYVVDRQTEIDDAVEAMKLGALDVLLMPCDVAALEKLVSGTIAQQLGECEQFARSRDVNGRLSKLTQREREVLELLVGAHSTKAIASRLKISPKTVFVHRARVLEKIGVDNLVELSLLVSGSRVG